MNGARDQTRRARAPRREKPNRPKRISAWKSLSSRCQICRFMPTKKFIAAKPRPLKAPSANETQHQICALRDAAVAPAMSPTASLELACAAYTSATMPVGRQQHSVQKIAGTKWFEALIGTMETRGGGWLRIGGGGAFVDGNKDANSGKVPSDVHSAARSRGPRRSIDAASPS